MVRTVYVDILICVNLFVNYFLLLAVSGITKSKVSRLRLILGALVGAVASLTILIDISRPLLILLRLAISALCVICAFGYKGLGLFLRHIALFYAVTFVFAGVMFALFSFCGGNGMVKNSVIYLDISPLMLIAACIVCYGTVCLLSRFFRPSDFKKDAVMQVKARLDNRTVNLTAIGDTGNFLTEAFSGYPVIVANLDCILPLIPMEAVAYFEGKSDVPTGDFARRLRLIPYRTVGSSALMPGFRPDEVIITAGNKTACIQKIYIAVSGHPVSGGEYDAIVNPDIAV